MNLLHALILGIVQGIAEFIPISSSGFLILVPEIFSWEVQPLAFDTTVHLGTLTAVIIGLFPEVRQIFLGFFQRHPDVWGRLGWMIILATLPAIFVGFFAGDFIEIRTRSKEVVAVSFIIWGSVLYLADRFANKCESTQVTEVSWKKSFIIGCAQVIALIPGTSRSGITITAGLFGKLSRETATKFSFLLGIPAIFAAGMYQSLEVVRYGADVGNLALVIGFFASFVSGLLTIQILLSFVKRYSYASLAIVRVFLGL